MEVTAACSSNSIADCTQDNYNTAGLAKVAMLMPVSMDLYSVFKDPFLDHLLIQPTLRWLFLFPLPLC